MTTQQKDPTLTGDELTLDEWMDKEDGGGRGAYLRNWKEDGEIKILLHRTAPAYALFRHPWFVVGKKGKIRLTRFNSLESKQVNEARNFRNDDGSREVPPTVCPFALTLEWIYKQIQAGKIPWTADVFRIGDDEEERVLKAGGVTGLFNKRDLTDEQKKELKKAGAKIGEAYKEDLRVQEEALYVVVEYDNAANGPVIAFANRSLDQAFRAEMRRRRKEYSDDVEKADPRKNPVVFEWSIEKRKDGSNFSDYKVTATRDPINEEHLEAISGEVPDTTRLREANNVALLRQQFEEAWCFEKVTPPWDELFAPAMKLFKGLKQASLPEDFDPDEIEGHSTEGDDGEKAAPKPATDPKTTTTVVAPAAAEDVPCDECGKGIPDALFAAAEAAGGSGEVTCPHCSTVYALDKETGDYKKKPKEEPKKEEVRASRRRTTSK